MHAKGEAAMRKWLYMMVFVGALLAVLSLVSCNGCGDKKGEDVSYVSADDTLHPIHPFMTDSGLVLVIPSYYEEDNILYKDLHQNKYVTFDSTSREKVKIVHSKLPTVYIQTESGSMDFLNSAKGNKEKGFITVIDAKGEIECHEVIESMHGRGSATWWGKKKPYAIKLKKKVKMLGLKKAKKFTLLSQYYDCTGLRNWLSYSAAKRLGMPYIIDCDFANVYFNGEYGGCYLLANKVDINKSGVNIHDSEKDRGEKTVSGGFLMEIDYREKALKYVSCAFPMRHGGYMMIKSPKDPNDKQRQYIMNLWNHVEDAVFNYSKGMSNGELDSLVDLSSFVKNYLCQEVFMNMDAGTVSFYLYKDRDITSYSKIVASPIWDFDISMHNPFSFAPAADLCEVIYAGAGATPDKTGFNGILGSLYKNEHFRQIVATQYFTRMRPVVENLMWGATWDSICSLVQTDMEIDNLRWHQRNSFLADCLQIQKWMKKRLTYLDKVWMPDSTEKNCHVYFEINHMIYNHLILYSIPKGSKWDIKLPPFRKNIQTEEGYEYQFKGWSINGKPVVLDTLHVQHDLYIKSDWETIKEPDPIQSARLWLYELRKKRHL